MGFTFSSLGHDWYKLSMFKDVHPASMDVFRELLWRLHLAMKFVVVMQFAVGDS